MNTEKVISLLDGLPFTVETVDVCGSTNDELKRRAPELPDLYLLAAARQTAGKGRMGRSFYSPEGTGLYMSLLLRPDLPPECAALITPAAAVAVCRAVSRVFGLETGIKWVNDVYYNGKKVCGILTESLVSASGALEHAVLGVGINIAPPPGGFPPELEGIAGTLLQKYENDARERLCAGFLRSFYPIYKELSQKTFVPEYRRRSFLIGRDIDVHSHHMGGAVTPARVLDVDGDCGLVISRPDGTVETLTAGEVTVRER